MGVKTTLPDKKLNNKKACKKIVNDAKKVLSYQNHMIKSQSDDMLLLVSLLNAKDKELDRQKNSIDNNTQKLEYCFKDMETFRKKTEQYMNIQFILFIVFLILIIVLFFRFRKTD